MKSKTPATGAESGLIKETTDYKLFGYVGGNRKIKPGHVKKLMRSFEKKPHLRLARPILLNEFHQVVDGQHRLEASKRMRISVYYMVVPGLTIQDARLLNSIQDSWVLMDYAESYAYEGNRKYELFVKLHDEYGLTPSSLQIFMEGKQAGGGAFRAGLFQPESEDVVRDRLNKLESFSKYLPAWEERSFAIAVFTMISNKEYDHQRMMSKLEKTMLTRQPDRLSYLRVLEDIYNYDVKLTARVRFY